MRSQALLLWVSLMLSPSLWAWGRELSPDEEIHFMAQPASQSESGVQVRIEAFVFEYERRPGLHRAFARYLDLDIDDLSPDQVRLFRERTQLFRIDAERGKRPWIRFANGQQVQLSATNPKGRSTTSVVLSLPVASGEDGWIDFSVRMPVGDGRSFGGRVQLLEAHGWSVVSDIDDTIKHSNVGDRRELLLNTFVRPFVAVPGLAGRYQELAEQGARFHYVSSSPVQLDPPLSRFLREQAFPAGSLHLRTLDLSDEIFATASPSRAHKINQISALLDQFGERQFMLIGDSGEADPEIYAELMIRYPDQVLQLLIRDVTGEPRRALRYRELLPDHLAERLQIFTDAQQVPSVLPTVAPANSPVD
jgi:phosphatidate phosphatase APP1